MATVVVAKKPLFVVLLIAAVLSGEFLIGRASADQPRMQAALDALRLAERELEAADNDKGGHRAKAIIHTRKAIAEVEKGIRFDRRH
jgi:hypothetical protein